MAVDYAKVLKQDAPDAWTGEEAVCFLCGLARNEYLSIKDNALNIGQGNVISGLAGAKISNSLSFQEQHPEQYARLVKVSDMKKTLERDTVVRVIPSYCDTKGTHYYRRKEFINWAISKEYDIPAPLRAFVASDEPQTKLMGGEEKKEEGGRRDETDPEVSRTSQLHCFIWRVYQSLLAENKKAVAQKVWQEIMNEKRRKSHDTEEIIQKVTAEEISWSSTYGNAQTFKRSSLDSLLTRMRENPPC